MIRTMWQEKEVFLLLTPRDKNIKSIATSLSHKLELPLGLFFLIILLTQIVTVGGKLTLAGKIVSVAPPMVPVY